MTNLPPIPKDRNWSPETWRAGLDEAVKRTPNTTLGGWDTFSIYHQCSTTTLSSIQAHATTLLDAGIVKPVISEAEAVLQKLWNATDNNEALAIIQSALDKARAGQ